MHKTTEGWTIFQGKDAFEPELYDPDKYYFEPDNNSGEVYSEGYDYYDECLQALEEWVKLL